MFLSLISDRNLRNVSCSKHFFFGMRIEASQSQAIMGKHREHWQMAGFSEIWNFGAHT